MLTMMMSWRTWIVLPMLCLVLSELQAQVAVRGRVEIEGGEKARRGSIPGTVVWLTPVLDAGNDAARPAVTPPPHAQLVQKNKSFDPHILVVQAGTAVEFPNR